VFATPYQMQRKVYCVHIRLLCIMPALDLWRCR